VVRHAEAGKVTVGFRDHAGACGEGGAEVVVEIADDGCGFDPSHVGEGHLGLITMRERAEDLGGCLEVRSRPGRGTRVILRVPTAGFRPDPSPGACPKPGTGPRPGIGQQG
jgi:signal transduction histidine kinase